MSPSATFRSLVTGVALAALAAGATAALVELGLALADYPPAYTEHQRLFVEYDSVRGWRNVANGYGRYVTPEYSVEMGYNARAYRGPLREFAKPEGTFRVLLLGDSYLEGYTVSLTDRVAEVAERMLNRVPSPRASEVIALGTGGYSTDQELLWLQSDGVRYAPDLVVLLFVTNDIWFNAQLEYPRGPKPLFRLAGDSVVLTNVPVPHPPPTPGPAPPASDLLHAVKRFVHQESRLVRLAERAVHRSPWLQRLVARARTLEKPDGSEDAAAASSLAPEFTPFADSPTPQADTALEVTARLLARMATVARGAGAGFVAVLVPANDALYPPGAPQSRHFQRTPPVGDHHRASERFLMVCARARVRCLDPTARFVAAADSLARRDQLLVFPEDGHWNEHGHRVAAAVVADLARDAMDSTTTRPPLAHLPTPSDPSARAPRGGLPLRQPIRHRSAKRRATTSRNHRHCIRRHSPARKCPSPRVIRK